MTADREPRTEAGRAFCNDGALHTSEDRLTMILAIEAEARAQERALREAADRTEVACRRFITGTFDRGDEAMARMALDDLRALLAPRSRTEAADDHRREPQTEAGRALLRLRWDGHVAGSMREHILAIEAEARAEERERAEALRVGSRAISTRDIARAAPATGREAAGYTAEYERLSDD